MMQFSRITLVAGIVAAFGTVSNAQNVTVQQPVVETFRVGTTVSVPDRGTIYLGGVNSARSGSTRSGFTPFGSAGTREVTGRAATASVYIHDFASMDEALLNSAATGRTSGVPTTDPVLWHLRHGRRSGSAGYSSSPASLAANRIPSPGPMIERPAAPSPDQKIAKYMQSGMAAERAGKTSIAKNYYRLASRYGSDEARQRLSALDNPTRTLANSDE